MPSSNDRKISQLPLLTELKEDTIFLVVSTVSVTYGITSFDTLFNIGMIIFAFTAVTWWFWTIITVKYIITTMSSATTNLLEVKADLKDIRKVLEEEQNDPT